MSATLLEGRPARHPVAIAAVAALHILVGYALVTGLARKVVEVTFAPVQTKIVEETRPEPPPPPDLPPPPQLAPPPPPSYLPPPEVRVRPPPEPAPTITTTPVAPPPAPFIPTPPPAPRHRPQRHSLRPRRRRRWWHGRRSWTCHAARRPNTRPDDRRMRVDAAGLSNRRTRHNQKSAALAITVSPTPLTAPATSMYWASCVMP